MECSICPAAGGRHWRRQSHQLLTTDMDYNKSDLGKRVGHVGTISVKT